MERRGRHQGLRARDHPRDPAEGGQGGDRRHRGVQGGDSRLRVKNPFLKEDSQLNYVGSKYFEQKRQIGVPMVVNEVQDGKFKTLFIGSVE